MSKKKNRGWKAVGDERSQLLQNIRAERERQVQKWGDPDHLNVFWYAILGEEVGEVAEIVQSIPTGEERALMTEGRLREELVQVAAVCLAWLECMNRRERKEENIDD